MKNLFFVSVAFSIFSGASLSSTAQKSVRFIDGIEINPEPVTYNVATSTYSNSNTKTPAKKTVYKPVSNTITSSFASTEACHAIQFKYAQIMDREVELLTNTILYNFIDDWWATRYNYGGTTKKGIDCSAFTGLLESNVYATNLPRTAKDQYDACDKISRDDMVEGDMVFFNTRGGVSHVGVYLGNGYFVHASVSNGVTISNLNDDYYSRKFIGGGRPTRITDSAKADIK